jgi:hypothetical protein
MTVVSRSRLNVHQHIGDSGIALLNRVFHSVSDLVPFVH